MTKRLNDVTPEEWDRVRKTQPRNERADDHEDLVFSKWVDLAMQESHDEEEDVVNSPTHYNTGNIECIEAIEESMSSVAFKGYLKGNCLKYLWRYDYKGKQVEDLQEATWYLSRLTRVVLFENEGEK